MCDSKLENPNDSDVLQPGFLQIGCQRKIAAVLLNFTSSIFQLKKVKMGCHCVGSIFTFHISHEMSA